MEDRDHDLLIVAVRDLSYLRTSLDEFRGANSERIDKQDRRIEQVEKDVADLRASRAKLYGAVASMSFMISVAIRFLWRG